MKHLFIILSFFYSVCLFAQQNIVFSLSQSELSPHITSVIEKNVSSLLSSFINAKIYDREPELGNISITENAKNNLTKTWNDNPFICDSSSFSRPVKILQNGMLEIRNIPLYMTGTWKSYQEATILMAQDGTIESFRLSLDPQNYAIQMSKARNLVETEQYEIILDYCERFRNAYCLQDINFLQKIFSDDALIIAGTVSKSKGKSSIKLSKEIENTMVQYKQYNKKSYIEHLQQVFNRNEKIQVTFDSIEVVQHDAIKGLYGVQLLQGYKSKSKSGGIYSDVGYLFLLWDFRDSETPQIHIRTWQDKRIWDTEAGKNVEKINIESFDY